MTKQEILSARKTARELYKSITCPSGPLAAAKEPLCLKDMTDVPVGDVSYSAAFCCAALDSLFAKKRGLQFSEEMTRQTALLWVQTFPDWTFADVRLFEVLLLTGQLPTYSLSGKEVGDMLSFDIPGIFDKLHAYNRKRPGYIQRLKEERIDGVNRKDFSKDEYRPRPPIWEIDPAAKQFDLLGVEHPPDWDYKAYWMARASPEETAHIAAKIHEINFKIHF